MPPHCDAKDGPVVLAAQRALDSGDVEEVLPYVHEEGEAEVRECFARVMAARACGEEARRVADEWFFETVVRIHRAGEGAAFTGLRPAGLGHGPVVPLAEAALQTGDIHPLLDRLSTSLLVELQEKFQAALRARTGPGASLAARRQAVEAELAFIVWSHKTYACISGPALHGEAPKEAHRDAHA